VGWGASVLDVEAITQETGHEPRRQWSGRSSGWPPADAIVVAPATINTVNKIAAGITDTWAVNVVVECMGLDVPIVIAPNVNPALGRHPRFRQNISELRSWGLTVLWEHDPTEPPWIVPWGAMLTALPSPPGG
jgi:phosphopantothenoylcysteine synthetase/decarboxylase